MSNVPTNLIPSTITQLPEYQGSSTLGYFAYSLEGRSYKVQFSQLAAVGAVPSTRVIAAGTGLTGGGDLSQDRVISIANGGVGTAQLADSGVIAGSYGSGTDVPVLTVDAKGRITAASTTPLSISGYVPTSRTITTGAGLLGGGSLASNLTLTVDFSSATPQALGSATAGVSTAAARGDHVHPAVDLSDTDQTQGALPLGRGGTGDALSPVAGAVVYSTGTKFALADPGLPGQVLTSDGAGEPYWQTIAGTGTVTDVSVVTANGFAGTVANPNTTPEITVSTTVTGVVKGNGTALSAAVAGTDYVAPGVITGSGLTMATSRLLGRTTASSGAVEEITVGTGLSLSGGSLVNSAPDQVVSFTSGTGISVSGTYPAFTITNTAPDQVVSLTAGSGISITGSYPSFTIAATGGGGSGTVTSVDVSGSTTGLTFTGGPITTSGTITMGGTLVVANGGTGATTAAGARTNLGAAASGANSDITSMSGLTGAISSPTYIQFGNGSGTTLAAGRMWYDQTTGSMNVGMGGGNITQQIGEELFVYGKASAAITEGQVVVKTGAAGASGVITFAPAPLGTTDSQAIIGVATENIALNGFGRITAFGVVHGINTTGSAYGETWADGDTLYYNPNYVGGLTNVKPSAPNQKTEVGIVINAGSGGSGSIQVEIIHGTSLGGTDNNVQLTSPTNNDLLQYYAAGPYWRNLAPSSVSVGTATNLAGGAANRIAYQTGAGATGFITAPSVANTFLEWSGSAFQWSSNPLGTVTSVDVSGGTTGLTTSGGPVTTSGTITLAGTLNVANGGTGATSLTSGYLVKGNGTSAASASVVYDDGTNVGIGTSSPGYKLDVNGTGSFVGSSGVGAIRVAGAGGSWFWIDNPTGTTMRFSSGATAGTNPMVLDSSGNVGIGISSPVDKLNVSDGTATFQFKPLGGSSIGYMGMRTNHALGFTTNDTERMRVTAGGDVLIGTTTPDQKLTVNGAVAATSFTVPATFGTAFVGYSSGNAYIGLYNSTGSGGVTNTIDFFTGGTQRMRINSSGAVSIAGTTLTVGGSNVAVGLQSTGQQVISSSTALTSSSNAGSNILVVTAGITLTLPTSAISGKAITISNISSGNITLSYTGSAGTDGPTTMAAGTSLMLISDGGSPPFWRLTLPFGAFDGSTLFEAGYKILPQNQRTGAYTLALSDQGKHIYATAGAFAITVPANSTTAFPIGTAITIVCEDAAKTVSPAGGVTLVLAGTGAATTGTRTLAIGSVATLIKVQTDRWYISGSGVT